MKKISFMLIIALCILPALISCSGNGGDTVMIIGSNSVDYDEYRYFYMNFRKDHEKLDETDYAETLKSEIEDALRQKYAKYNFAVEKAVKLDKDDYSAIKEAKQYYIDSYGGDEQFNTAIAESWLTDELFYNLLCEQAIEEKLREFEYDEYTGDIISDDKTVQTYIEANFIHATHVLILNEAGDDISANFDLARDIQKRAASGEDFNTLIALYNEDTDMNGDPTGYYFAEGQLLPEFENAAKVLKIGEISEVILSERGYHIIKRLPLDAGYIDDHFEQLREIYKTRIFNVTVAERAEAIEVEYTDYYTTLTDDMLVNNIRKVKN